MAFDRAKALETAERFLKQGKVQAALDELQRVSKSAPNDIITLNRLGDLYARQGRNAEAIGCYNTIAGRFTHGGFLPKAVAIYKKILRLDAKNSEALLHLGELYLEQRLTGEARQHLLAAAALQLEAQQFDRARRVYEKLVKAEPSEPRHRVRLAETLAAQGETGLAGEQLLELGRTLFADGQLAEAEKVYVRAGELLPARYEPVLGIARTLAEQGRVADAARLLEETSVTRRPEPQVLGELALLYELGGRGQEALDLLSRAEAVQIPPLQLQQIFGQYLLRGEATRIWSHLDLALAAVCQDGDPQTAILLLENLAELEPEGHVQALQRLLEVQQRIGDRAGTIRALEWLVRAYQTRSMHDEASLMLDQLRELAPGSPLANPPPIPEVESLSAEPAVLDAVPSLLESEAPAVPLNRTEEEFVAGRLTQAEILEKYGLPQQAREQLREVVRRFPGHVEAQERTVAMWRATGDRAALGDSLVRLALALRAAGESKAARQAADEALALSPASDDVRRTLEQVGLATPATAEVRAPEVAAEVPAEVPADVAAESDGDEIVIDFDDSTARRAAAPSPLPAVRERTRPPSRPAPPAAAAEPPPPTAGDRRATREPSQDMLDEIRFYIDGQMLEDAARRVSALGALGYKSAALDRLAEAVEQARPGPSEPVAAPAIAAVSPSAPAPQAAAWPGGAEEDDDLRAITAALEEELFREEEVPAAPRAAEAADQSFDEIFAVFRHHVQQEVGSEDFRTHYDLGIAYKEMGLTDEAIQEFEVVSRSRELYGDACNMIAICHRDRQDLAQAASWYRKALDAPIADPETQCGLRYDLAEVLLEAGDNEAALHLFRDVMRSRPSFRDVGRRIDELESSLQS